MSDYKDLPIVSLLDSCELCAKASNGLVEKNNGGFETYKSIGFWYNRYFIHDMSAEELEKNLGKVFENLPKAYPVLLFYERNKENEAYDKILVKNGFMLLFTQTGMNLDMSEFDLEDNSDNIREISREQVKEWAEVDATAFDKPYEDECFYAMKDAKDDNVKFYAYFDGEKIVGTCMSYLKDGVLGIHEVGVDESHRRQGIARKLVVHALNEGKRKGAKYSSLQASPFGKPLYESLGYKVINELQNVVVRPKE